MASFSPDWLALREPADRAARSVDLTRLVAGAVARDSTLRALDLGGGTGSNVRYLTEHLRDDLPAARLARRSALREGGTVRGGVEHWLLVDRDARLLEALPACVRAWAADDPWRGGTPYEIETEGREVVIRQGRRVCRVLPEQRDLVTLDASIFAGRQLVTAAALLDLVSKPWIEALAERCRASGAAVLFALTYDGRLDCSPHEPEDEMVTALVNRHQRTDKGFGPAAGPEATAFAAGCFRRAGYDVRRATSDWVLAARDASLQRSLVEGWAEAALEIAPQESRRIGNWRERRLAHVWARTSAIRVGHEDLAAWLPDEGGRWGGWGEWGGSALLK